MLEPCPPLAVVDIGLLLHHGLDDDLEIRLRDIVHHLEELWSAETSKNQKLCKKKKRLKMQNKNHAEKLINPTHLRTVLKHIERHTLVREAPDLLAREVGDEADEHGVRAVGRQPADCRDRDADLAEDLEGARGESVRFGHAEAAEMTGDEDDGDCG